MQFHFSLPHCPPLISSDSRKLRPAFRKSRTACAITWAEEREANELHVAGSRLFGELSADFPDVRRTSSCFGIDEFERESEKAGDRAESGFSGGLTRGPTQMSVRWMDSEVATRTTSPSRAKSAKSGRTVLAHSVSGTSRRVSTSGTATAALSSSAPCSRV